MPQVKPRIVIKKKVTLEFLGDEYKDGYVNFSSIPMREYEEIEKKLEELKNSENESKSVIFVRDLVTSRFVDGKFPIEGELSDISREDLPDFPAEFFINAMSQLNGAPSPN